MILYINMNMTYNLLEIKRKNMSKIEFFSDEIVEFLIRFYYKFCLLNKKKN